MFEKNSSTPSHKICPYCKEPIENEQLKVWDQIESACLHLGCSIELDDDLTIWGYEGDG